MKHDKALAYAAFATVCLVWGTTYLAIRIAIETIPPLLMTGARFVAGGAIMLLIAKLRGEVIPRDRKTLVNLVIVGFALIAVGNLAVVWAEQWVPSGTAALLVATAPFWMAILEATRTNGERTSLRAAIGMLIGFGGVAMLVAPGGASGNFSMNFVLGALAIQLGSFVWQLGSMRSKYNLKHVPPMMSASLQMLFGGAIVTIVGFAIGEGPRFFFTPRTFAAHLYLTIFGSILAFSAYIYALAHLRTSVTSLYAYVNPVVAVFLGWLILGEQLTWLSIVATVVILGGVALVQTGAPRAPKVEPNGELEQKAA